MVLLKSVLRFAALLILSAMFVYAPEILSAVSISYSRSAARHSLLRISLRCDPENADAMQALINDYQKQYPAVNLRIAYISQEQLTNMQPPYPDVVLCCDTPGVSFPAAFRVAGNQSAYCAVSQHSTADQFAAYINEAISLRHPLFQN